jgi:hypothetical protein
MLNWKGDLIIAALPVVISAKKVIDIFTSYKYTFHVLRAISFESNLFGLLSYCLYMPIQL